MNQTTTDCDVATRFGKLIQGCDYSAACALLTQEAQLSNPPSAIKAVVEKMIAYGSSPILDSQVIEEGIVLDWPEKQPQDLAMVYVALSGESFSEAVTLTLAQEGQQTRIRQLVWGRP